jgi:hypothetical protein
MYIVGKNNKKGEGILIIHSKGYPYVLVTLTFCNNYFSQPFVTSGILSGWPQLKPGQVPCSGIPSPLVRTVESKPSSQDSV